MGLGGSKRDRVKQEVKSYNHPPFCRHKLKRLLCGDPVKVVIDRMRDQPNVDVQEECCEKLAKLGLGPFYNGLIGIYGGLELIILAINTYNRDQLCMFACVRALTMCAENGPNAARLREMKADVTVKELKKVYKRDTFMALDCDAFFETLQETGVKLASEYVEDATIEEDCPRILDLLGTYMDLEEVVETGVKQIERLLKTEDLCMDQMKENGKLELLVTLIQTCRTKHMVVYRCLSIMHLLTDDDGLALELGKAGAVRLCLELIREKKSGKHAELLQLTLFLLCRLVLVEANAILFHKLYGPMVTDDIAERIKADRYDYPIVLPLRLQSVVADREAILARDEANKRAEHPERNALEEERKAYEGESLVQALVLRRDQHVIQSKKAALAWEFQGVDFDPLASKKEQDPEAWKTWKKAKAKEGPMVVGFKYEEGEEEKESKGARHSSQAAQRGMVQGAGTGVSSGMTASVLPFDAGGSDSDGSLSDTESEGGSVATGK